MRLRHQARVRAILVVATTATGAPALAAEGDVCGRRVTTFEPIAAELAADPKLKPVPNGGPDFHAYRQEQPTRIWYVTKPHYPKIQAVFCRFLEEENGQHFVKVESSCYGDKPVCDRLVAYFAKATN